MAPRPSTRQKTVRKGSEGKPTQNPSDSAADNMVKTARNALAAIEKRRALKRKSIEEKHDEEVKRIEAQINSLFDKRKQRILNECHQCSRAKLQVSQWEKLEALNARRMDLEALILSTMKSMERHAVNLCSELSAMFEGRLEDIQESRVVI